ncbi:YbfB/YjiJ family MFS transporter [Pseudomonas sp. GV071]|uniref:YbfB/YjiJ family MFS transporter n=1 Tax=Pseudomonas sp. GV071 TaxID=2135754 RepID=UPI000D42AE00|nr:putative MFS family arabinose efflux permease [Pseudomonas sp. GV071]
MPSPHSVTHEDSPRQPSVMHAIIAGLCASLVGIGLARFAYTPLIPSLIEAQWFAANDVMYLGAANLVGYLAGALSGRPIARRLGGPWTLRLMMALASLAFLACAFPVSVLWVFAWRFVSGLAGGAIMVLAATSVLPFIPGARKGLASGAIFLGLGLGIAASGTLVPLLLNLGLQQTWIGLGVLSALLTATSWSGWPTLPSTPAVEAAGAEGKTSSAMKLLYAQYALMAVALVPMMVFLVDYVARGLQWGAHWGAMVWVVYGIGAILGPMVYGALADRIGFATTSRVVLVIQAVAIALLALNHSVPALVVAVLVIGSFPPGIVPVNLGRIQHLLPGDLGAQNHAWSRATTAFALFQALAGYAYSYLYAASGGNYTLLFGIGGGAVVLALLLDVIRPAATPRDLVRA